MVENTVVAVYYMVGLKYFLILLLLSIFISKLLEKKKYHFRVYLLLRFDYL
jgi:hypothetical protein